MASFDIKASIIRILPKLPTEVVENAVKKLVEIGVESADDLLQVKEDDLCTVMRPIPLRTLLSSWKLTGDLQQQDSSSATSHTQSSSLLRLTSSSALIASSSNSSLAVSAGKLDRLLDKYSIRWETLPMSKKLKGALQKHTRLDPALLRQLVRVISADIGQITEVEPGRQQLDRIAREAVDKYPKSLKDEIDGEVIGRGHDSFLMKLVYRFDNLNRSTTAVLRHKRQVEESAKNSDDETPSGAGCDYKVQKLQKLTDKYGCIKWQPSAPPENVPDDVAIKMQQELVAAHEECRTGDDIFSKLQDLYYHQRKDINSGVTIGRLRDSWPHLFSEQGMNIHCKELTGVDVKGSMTNAFENKVPRILQFMASSTGRKKSVEAMSRVLDKVTKAKTESSSNMPEVLGLVMALLTHFEEDTNQLLCVRDSPLTNGDVVDDLPPTPCIVACGDSVLTSKDYQLAIDRMVVMRLNNPLSALAVQFASFFVFNLQYPVGAAVTMEFVQRCLVNINPAQGSKGRNGGKKHYHTINPHLLKFINDMAASEWCLSG